MNVYFHVGSYPSGRLCEFDKGFIYDFRYYKRLKNIWRLMSIDAPLVRIGNSNDGGYLMADTLKGGIAYSFGISDDVSWDDDMADRGYDIYMYDPTIDKLPFERDEFHFFKEGLAGAEAPYTRMNTLKNFINQNGHTDEKDMILKIDIEGCEWDFLSTVESETLSKFDQILFEFHEVIYAKPEEEANRILTLLKKLNETHQLVHLHGNNCDFHIRIGGQNFPNTYEAIYVNRNNYIVSQYDNDLPHYLDAPNDLGRSDISLSGWNNPLEYD